VQCFAALTSAGLMLSGTFTGRLRFALILEILVGFSPDAHDRSILIPSVAILCLSQNQTMYVPIQAPNEAMKSSTGVIPLSSPLSSLGWSNITLCFLVCAENFNPPMFLTARLISARSCMFELEQVSPNTLFKLDSARLRCRLNFSRVFIMEGRMFISRIVCAVSDAC